MSGYSLSHVSDPDLARELASLAAQDRSTTAAFLARIAEFDGRRLYQPAGFPSMFLYCVHELHLSEDSALKRIRAARTARRFPAIFEALADGRLSLSAVVLLTPYLTPENSGELLVAAAHRTKAETKQFLAERFPRSEMLALVGAIPSSAPRRDEQLAPGPVGNPADSKEAVGAFTGQMAPGPVEPINRRSRMVPIAHERFFIPLTVGRETHDDLQYAQALMSHQIPPGDVAAVIGRALKALIREQEKRRFAATNRPRMSPRPATGKRYIPAHVKRAAWERDGGRCTFVSRTGQRCPARTMLEYDHIDPVARGGQATVENISLKCRAHNQHAAECTFGTEFMVNKREEARRARAEARAAAERRVTEQRNQTAAAAEKAKERDVIPALRSLGLRADEARQAAEHCDSRLPDAPLEERIRAALRFHGSRVASRRWCPAD